MNKVLSSQLRSALAGLALAAALTLGSSSARADAACPQALQPTVQWLKSQPYGPGDYAVRVTMAATGATGNVFYATGLLSLNAAGTALVGRAEQFQSRYTWSEDDFCSDGPDATGQPPLLGLHQHPFDPASTGSTSISINVATGAFAVGGDTVQSAVCASGLVRGDGQPGGTRYYYLLALKPVFAPKQTVPN